MKSLVCCFRTNEKKLSTNSAVYELLVKFPYFKNYVDLTRLELGAIQAVQQDRICNIAFIGSGPLPLSSLQLSHTLPGDVKVMNIDHDPTAISQSKNLCARLETRGMGMEFSCKEAGACDLRKFDVVYLEALVGCEQEEKERMIVETTANMREGSILLIRSAHGLRRVLYAVSENPFLGKDGWLTRSRHSTRLQRR